MPRATPLSPDERRAAIMAATEPLLEQHGRNVSTRQIAEAAGIAEGTIFRVFPSKDCLIDAVITDAFDVGLTCDELRRIDLTQDLESRLVAAATLLQKRLRRVFALFHALALQHETAAVDARRRHQQDNERLDGALSDLMSPDQQLLAYPPADAANLLRTLTFAISHPLLSDQRHSDPEQIVSILLHGITRPPHEELPC